MSGDPQVGAGLRLPVLTRGRWSSWSRRLRQARQRNRRERLELIERLAREERQMRRAGEFRPHPERRRSAA
jgi:hypothetical protein